MEMNRRRRQKTARTTPTKNKAQREEIEAALARRTKASIEKTESIERQKADERQKRRLKALEKEAEGTNPYNKLVNVLLEEILQAENRIHDEKKLDNTYDEDYIQAIHFIARSKAVKETQKAAEKLLALIQQKFKPELKYSKEDIFPTQWMLKNQKIMATIERYELLIPLLNHVFNLNRYTRGDELKKMFSLNDEVLRGEKYGQNEREWSSFVTDSRFYRKLRKKFGRSDVFFKKHIQALSDGGILIKAGRIPRRGGTTLYLDGYFAPYGENGLRKVSFVKNDKYCRQALQNFKISW